MSNELTPYSVHSFMLPIRWDYLPKSYDLEKGKESVSFEKRTYLKKISELLTANNSGWKRKFFRINGKSENYNEYHYFHAYASTTLFDLQQSDEKETSIIHPSKVMLYFELVDNEDKDDSFFYEIKTLEDGNYKLLLTGISLHVYNTGIAILTFNLENNSYVSKEDILKINEFGRRIYPQFLNDTDKQADDEGQVNPNHTFSVKRAFLASSIRIGLGKEKTLSDDFIEYNDVRQREVHHIDEKGNYERSWVVRMPAYIRSLFKDDSFCFSLGEEKEKKIRLNILGDDRMFFQCWYGNNEVSADLSKTETTPKKHSYRYITDAFWYAYLFGDKISPSIANIELQTEQCKIHTYARWADYGTLTGFSRDSFVSVSQTVPTLLMYKVPNLRTQMKTIYYQMAVLCLAQRASLLRFSAEVTRLADLARMENDEVLIKNIKVLYSNYVEFINKINFREITPYIQGIEMYSQFREVMQTQKDVEALDRELNELFTYIKLYEDEKQNKTSEKLNIIAFAFLPASFLASMFGISFISESTEIEGEIDDKIWTIWGIIIIGGALIGLLLWFIIKFLKQKK